MNNISSTNAENKEKKWKTKKGFNGIQRQQLVSRLLSNDFPQATIDITTMTAVQQIRPPPSPSFFLYTSQSQNNKDWATLPKNAESLIFFSGLLLLDTSYVLQHKIGSKQLLGIHHSSENWTFCSSGRRVGGWGELIYHCQLGFIQHVIRCQNVKEHLCYTSTGRVAGWRAHIRYTPSPPPETPTSAPVGYSGTFCSSSQRR